MTDDWKLQASYKHGSREQHLLNVRAADSTDLTSTLESLHAGTLETVVATGHLLAAVDTVINTPEPVQQAPTPLQQLQQQAATPTPVQPTPPPQIPEGTHMCLHGVRKYVSKVGPKGPWQAWMCAAAQGDPTKCEPEWIR